MAIIMIRKLAVVYHALMKFRVVWSVTMILNVLNVSMDCSLILLV